MSASTLVHPPALPGGCWGGRQSWASLPQELRAPRKESGERGINRGKGQPLPVLPLPTLPLQGDKTFNYRYSVPLRIPNVLVASPPRTSFHGKIRAKSQGGKGENPTSCGFLAKERRREER